MQIVVYQLNNKPHYLTDLLMQQYNAKFQQRQILFQQLKNVINKSLTQIINFGHYIMNKEENISDKKQIIQVISQPIVKNNESNNVVNPPVVQYIPKIFPIAKIRFSYKINNEQLVKDQIFDKKQVSKSQSKQKQNISKKNILVLCTGNSCRSQIVQAYLKKFLQEKAQVKSAGVQIHGVNPKTIQILAEDGIDISHHTSNHVNEYRHIPFDYVITVCDNARQTCPYFPSNAVRIHHTFPDPAKVKGSEQEIMNCFRNVRQQICVFCKQFSEKQFQKRQDCKQGICQVFLQKDQTKNNLKQKQSNQFVQSEVEVFKIQQNKSISSNSVKKQQKHQSSLKESKSFEKKQLSEDRQIKVQDKVDKKQIKVQNSESEVHSLGIQNYHIQTPKSQLSFSNKNPESQQKNNQDLFSSNRKTQNLNINFSSPISIKKQNNLSLNVLNLVISPNSRQQSINFHRKIFKDIKFQQEPIVASTQINAQDIPLAIRKAWKNKGF